MHHVLIAVLGVVVVTSGVANTSGTLGAEPERNGLTDDELSTLWSGDNDASVDPMGSTTSSEHSPLANATDITFQRPPRTAKVWARNDFADYVPGNETTSVAPTTATLADSWAIKDAHATIFGLSPSTVAHVNATTTRRYVAPNGTLRATIDYRIEPPANDTTGNKTESWTIDGHEISDIRLKTRRTVLARTDSTHTPQLAFRLTEEGPRTLMLTAEIEARLKHTVTTWTSGPNRTTKGQRETTVTVKTDSITVHDQLPVTVYVPTVTVRRATFPNGSTGFTFTANQPWQGLSAARRSASVRTNWRFYTARSTGWDRLVHRTADEAREFRSPARPVRMHAYPSRRGPRAVPYDTGPVITSLWGPSRSRPNETIRSSVHVDAVRANYTTTRGLVVRAPGGLSGPLRAHGIINGTVPEIDQVSEPRSIHPSILTVAVHNESNGTALLRLELRDGETDQPISLADGARRAVSLGGGHATSPGFIAVGGQRVQTNSSGIALVRVQRPGVYPAQYHPGSWLVHDRAYVGDTAVARWHPLTSVTGWVSFGLEAFIGLLPLVGALYVGRELGRLVKIRRSGRP